MKQQFVRKIQFPRVSLQLKQVSIPRRWLLFSFSWSSCEFPPRPSEVSSIPVTHEGNYSPASEEMGEITRIIVAITIMVIVPPRDQKEKKKLRRMFDLLRQLLLLHTGSFNWSSSSPSSPPDKPRETLFGSFCWSNKLISKPIMNY